MLTLDAISLAPPDLVVYKQPDKVSTENMQDFVALFDYLKAQNLQAGHVAADGDCGFSSVAEQLNVLGVVPRVKGLKRHSVQSVRGDIAFWWEKRTDKETEYQELHVNDPSAYPESTLKEFFVRTLPKQRDRARKQSPDSVHFHAWVVWTRRRLRTFVCGLPRNQHPIPAELWWQNHFPKTPRNWTQDDHPSLLPFPLRSRLEENRHSSFYF